jgi:cytidylate kinase
MLPIVPQSVVCISREEGAGAEETATRVATALGYRLFDEDIVTRAALEAGVDRDVVANVERRRSALSQVIEVVGAASLSGAGYVSPAEAWGRSQPPSDELRALILSVIEETATAGSAVIVAHAASLALAERDDVLRVLITASPHTRQRRLADVSGVDEKAAARTIKKSDVGRAAYMKRFHNVSDELPIHYDLVINTDKLEPEHAARLIVHAAQGADAAPSG